MAVVAPRIKGNDAEKTANLGRQGLVGKLFETFEEARRVNINNAGKQPPAPKNHVQANVNRMRQIQRQAREKERTKVSLVR